MAEEERPEVILEQVRSGVEALYIHECGHTEWITDSERAAVGGGCDACESGSPRQTDWSPLYRMTFK
jgi:hypothetical protein